MKYMVHIYFLVSAVPVPPLPPKPAPAQPIATQPVAVAIQPQQPMMVIRPPPRPPMQVMGKNFFSVLFVFALVYHFTYFMMNQKVIY